LVNGALYKFLEGAGNEDIYYEVDTPGLELGAAGSPITYSIEFTMPFDARLVTHALLEIAVSVGDIRSVRWKVSFSDVVVTREFKPITCIRFRGSYYCKMVYNVKPIIASKLEKRLRTVVRYLGGDEIKIHHIGLLVTAQEEKAKSAYTYMSGFMELKPGEGYTVNIPSPMSGKLNLRIVAAFPETGGHLKIIDSSNNHLELRGVGIGDHNLSISGEGPIEIRAAGGGSILVSSLLLYKLHTPKPNIEVEVGKHNDALRVKIRNTGDSDADTVIVNCISLGVVVDRKIVGRLESGREVEVTLKYNPGSINTVRVVWRYKSTTEFRDVKLKL
jgi:hypothetical protein